MYFFLAFISLIKTAENFDSNIEQTSITLSKEKIEYKNDDSNENKEKGHKTWNSFLKHDRCVKISEQEIALMNPEKFIIMSKVEESKEAVEAEVNENTNNEDSIIICEINEAESVEAKDSVKVNKEDTTSSEKKTATKTKKQKNKNKYCCF